MAAGRAPQTSNTKEKKNQQPQTRFYFKRDHSYCLHDVYSLQEIVGKKERARFLECRGGGTKVRLTRARIGKEELSSADR